MIREEHFSQASRDVMRSAFQLAWSTRRETVHSGHILWALAGREESPAARILRMEGIDTDLAKSLVETLGKGTGPQQYLYLSQDGGRILELADAQAKKLGHSMVEPEHLLLGLLQEPGCTAVKLLERAGANRERLVTLLLEGLNRQWPVRPGETGGDGSGAPGALEEYGRDLTGAARQNQLDPVIAREGEIARMVQVLSRRTKNNPVLIGEPGVGKTAVVEGLAQRIAAGDVPENLLGKRIITLDIAGMLAGAKYRGEFEERLKAAMAEASGQNDVLLFIDEIHMLIGAGASEGSVDAANILKPALGRGECQVIGATTLAEYRRIEGDAALERRLQPVTVEEPGPEDAAAILHGLRDRYEQFHGLSIPDESIDAAVKLSHRYIRDRFLPDKAIDLLDEAASKLRTGNLTWPAAIRERQQQIDALEKEKQDAAADQNFERAASLRDQQKALQEELGRQKKQWASRRKVLVTPEAVADVVSAWSGIPVTMLTEDESRRLLHLEEILHRRVVGQDEAVKAVSKAVRRGRVGLKDPGRPTGVFLFLGPTGVGKTELCKALAEALFQDETAMLRVDMSEYMEPHSVSKLIGSPPGYVGYDEGGQLTEAVRRRPYSVILFDEIEKAHRDVWSILLQVMDDGLLTDAQGRHVDFKNTVIVMTSNLGAEQITGKPKSLGFSTAQSQPETLPFSEISAKVTLSLKETFRPEFLNRIDSTIVFHPLEQTHIRGIAARLAAELRDRVAEQGIFLEIKEPVLDWLAERGFDPVYGARPLRRVIQSELEDRVAECILAAGANNLRRITVQVKDGKLQFRRLGKKAPSQAEQTAAAVASH